MVIWLTIIALGLLIFAPAAAVPLVLLAAIAIGYRPRYGATKILT